MATEAKRERRSGRRDRGRTVYRLTTAQALKMRELGIFGDDEDVELWNGILYKMTKYAPHNFTVGVTAEALRPLIPEGCHVREEKTARVEPHYLPEPDIAVARGLWKDYALELPTLEHLALVVEVCESTHRSDYKQKPPVYARAGIPVYWVIDLRSREIVVFGDPQEIGDRFGYATQTRYPLGKSVDVVIGGQVRGQIAVDDVLPPPRPTVS